MITRNLVLDLADVAGARTAGAVLTVTAPPITDLEGDVLHVGAVRCKIKGGRLTIPLIVSGSGQTNPAAWQYRLRLTWDGGSVPEFSAEILDGPGDLAFTDLVPVDPAAPEYLPQVIELDRVDGLTEALDGLTEALGDQSGRGFPASVDATDLAGTFDPIASVYNGQGSLLRPARAGLMRAANGGTSKFHAVTIGDSLTIGYDGTTTVEAASFPRRLATFLAARTGLPIGGTGLTPAAVATGTATDRWSSTGTADRSLYPGFLTMWAGSTATYTSTVAGTATDLYYSNLSSPFTYRVDGGAVQTVTPNGSTAIGKHSLTGLANSTHTIVITAPTNFVFVTAVDVKAATGIVMHNLGFGGSTADIGGVTASWLDASSPTSINGALKATLDASGVVPDLFIICLGANDMFRGDTVAHAIAGIATIRTWYPTATVILVNAWRNPVTPQATWDAYVQAKYAQADTSGAVLVDFQHKTGTQAQAQAAGLLAADNTHPRAGVQTIWGQALADLIAG